MTENPQTTDKECSNFSQTQTIKHSKIPITCPLLRAFTTCPKASRDVLIAPDSFNRTPSTELLPHFNIMTIITATCNFHDLIFLTHTG